MSILQFGTRRYNIFFNQPNANEHEQEESASIIDQREGNNKILTKERGSSLRVNYPLVVMSTKSQSKLDPLDYILINQEVLLFVLETLHLLKYHRLLI